MHFSSESTLLEMRVVSSVTVKKDGDRAARPHLSKSGPSRGLDGTGLLSAQARDGDRSRTPNLASDHGKSRSRPLWTWMSLIPPRSLGYAIHVHLDQPFRIYRRQVLLRVARDVEAVGAGVERWEANLWVFGWLMLPPLDYRSAPNRKRERPRVLEGIVESVVRH
jgi:hypothetical protein